MTTYESELSKKLKTMPELVLTSVHIGLANITDKDNNRPAYCQDKWSVTVTYNGQEYTANYSSGLGSRKRKQFVRLQGGGYYHSSYGEFKNAFNACEAGWLTLVPPTLPDVMYCLLLDGRCAEGTFEDFCSEFGYDSDSRKALETYLADQVTRNSMIKMFGTELFNELSQLEH